MAIKKSNSSAPELAALQAELAALKKEVAALKSKLAKKSPGGTDPRVDKMLSVLKSLPSFKTICENKQIDL
tara:strand:+ start:303 stop:515 length:213 start_codon:yes stop_codon:yes gene_type:complete